MMGRRQRLVNGDEWDCVMKAPLCVYDKPGIRKKTKRRMNKRARLEARKAVRNLGHSLLTCSELALDIIV